MYAPLVYTVYIRSPIGSGYNVVTDCRFKFRMQGRSSSHVSQEPLIRTTSHFFGSSATHPSSVKANRRTDVQTDSSSGDSESEIHSFIVRGLNEVKRKCPQGRLPCSILWNELILRFYRQIQRILLFAVNQGIQ